MSAQHRRDTGVGPQQPRRLIVFDFVLEDKRGHFMNYLLGFRRAAEDLGLVPSLYVPADVDPAVVATLGARPLLPPRQQMFAPHVSDLLERLPTVAGLLSRVWDDVEREGVSADDILLFAEASAPALFDLGRWLGTLPEGGRPSVFVRFVGQEIKDGDSEQFNEAAEVYRLVSRLLAAAPGSDRVFYTINSPSQLSDLMRASGRRAFLMPMPKYYGDDDAGLLATANDGPIVVYIHVILADQEAMARAVADILLRNHPDIRVVLKFVRRGLDEPADTLVEGLQADRLRVVATGQPTDEYMAMIRDSDLVVQPYRPASYRVRNSGVFCEAAAFGKIAVVPAKTWMADEIENGRAAGVLFDTPTVTAVTAAVERALRQYKELSKAARSRAVAFRAEHNCGRNLALMLDMAATPHDMAVGIGEGDPIDFTSTVASRSYLAAGWSHTEPGFGVWSDGDQAELVLRVAPGELWPRTLRLTAAAYIVDARPRLDVEVLLNGIPFAEWRFTDQRPRERSLPVPANVDASPDLRVTFRIRQPASPRQLGLSPDDRQLGIVLKRLEFGDAAPGSAVDVRSLAISTVADAARRAVRRLRAFLPRPSATSRRV